MNEMIKDRFGKVQWKLIFQPEMVGVRFRFPFRETRNVRLAARRAGYAVEISEREGGMCFKILKQIHIPAAPPKPLPKKTRDEWEGAEDPKDLKSRLREAKERLVDWQERKAMADDWQDAAQAGARVMIWEAEVAALKAKLEEDEKVLSR